MIRKTVFILSIFLFCVSSLFSLSSENAVSMAIKEFENEIDHLAVTGVGNFVYADKNIGSSFSLYLQELVSQELQKSPKFHFSDREHLDEIMEEIQLGLTGITDDSTQPEPGMLKGLEFLVTGKFFDQGTTVQLFLELIDIQSGIVCKKVQYPILKSSIPAGISILPENYNDALFIIEELSEVGNVSPERLEIRAWNTRGDGGVYRQGENLVIYFYTNRDCYIKIYHIDVNKEASLIFPNPYYSDNFIQSEKIYKIPDPRYPFNFTLGEPFGIEFIKVIASTKQFKDIEEAFIGIGTASRELLSRGLSVEQKKALTTEAMFSYTILQ